MPADAVTLPATVVDVTYAGRHVDVVVAVGETRLLGQCPASFGREPGAGQQVKLSFAPEFAAFYAPGGQRIRMGGGTT